MKKTTILCLAFVMILGAWPALAQDKADWAFYGSVRMWTAWESVDDDTPPQLSNSGHFAFATSDAKARAVNGSVVDDDELAWAMQTNSRIGARVKWGDVGGQFEYGHSKAGSVTTRLLYGRWNFGPGTLTVGQDYGPYYYLISGLCGPGGNECTGIGLGAIYTGRTPQLKLTFGGLQIAAERPEKQNSFTFAYPAGTGAIQAVSNISTGNAATDTDQTLPRLSASYTFNLGPAQIFVGGLYNTYTQHFTRNGSDVEHDVDGWLLGAGTKMAFGPFYVNASVQYGENPNNAAGPYFSLYPSANLYSSATDLSEDAEYLGAQLVLGFNVSDSLRIEGSVMWQSGEVDDVIVAGRSWSQDTWTYGINCVWSPAKNVFIVPEIGVIDYNKLEVDGQNDIDFGKLTWAGVKWQINF